MVEPRLLKVGVVGAVVAAICCTPALVVRLGALGLSRVAGALDDVPPAAALALVGLIACAPIGQSRAAAERAESR